MNNKNIKPSISKRKSNSQKIPKPSHKIHNTKPIKNLKKIPLPKIKIPKILQASQNINSKNNHYSFLPTNSPSPINNIQNSAKNPNPTIHCKSFSSNENFETFYITKSNKNKTNSHSKENTCNNQKASHPEASSDFTSHTSKKSKSLSLGCSNVNPFTYVDSPKIQIFPPFVINEAKKQENNLIKVDSLFNMANYQTNLLKYCQTRKTQTQKQIGNKKKPTQLIYVQMNKNYPDDPVKYKPLNDKVYENRTNELKKKVRFWKAVLDYSIPRVFQVKYKIKLTHNNFKRKHNVKILHRTAENIYNNNNNKVMVNIEGKEKETSKLTQVFFNKIQL